MKLKINHQIYGHAYIQQYLTNVLRLANINSSWIFAGPSGVGKMTAASMFLAYVLSGAKPKENVFNFDEVKETLEMVMNGIHPDLFIVNSYTDDNSINYYRGVVSKIYKKPILSQYRVLVIDGAENLNINVFNALLKIFEEPPKQTIMMLVTTNMDIIPMTLRSRCAKLNFSKLSNDEVRLAISHNEIDEAVLLADGSIGDAMKLLDNDIYDKYLDLIGTIINKKAVDQRLNELLSDYEWWAIKKCIMRQLTCMLDMSLNIKNEAISKEIEIYGKLPFSALRISEFAELVINMVSNTDNMKLDRTIFMNWFVELLSKLLHE